MWKHYLENNNAKDRVQWVDLDRVDRSKFYLDDWDGQEKYEVIIWKQFQISRTIKGYPKIIAHFEGAISSTFFYIFFISACMYNIL